MAKRKGTGQLTRVDLLGRPARTNYSRDKLRKKNDGPEILHDFKKDLENAKKKKKK